MLLPFLSLSPSHFLSPAGQLERVLLFYFNWGSDVIGLLHAGLFNLDPGMCVCVCVCVSLLCLCVCAHVQKFKNKVLDGLEIKDRDRLSEVCTTVYTQQWNKQETKPSLNIRALEYKF